jgi:hypothetical protein
MGEKGNEVSAVTAAVARESNSAVERTFVAASETVVATGEDLATTMRNKGIEAVADNTVEEAREWLRRDPDTGEPLDPPPTQA